MTALAQSLLPAISVKSMLLNPFSALQGYRTDSLMCLNLIQMPLSLRVFAVVYLCSLYHTQLMALTTSVSDAMPIKTEWGYPLSAGYLPQPGNSLIANSSPLSPSQAGSPPEFMTQMWSAPSDPPAPRYHDRYTRAQTAIVGLLEHSISTLLDTTPAISISPTLSTKPEPSSGTHDQSSNFSLFAAMTNTYSYAASKSTPSVPTSIETLTLIPTPRQSTDLVKSSKPSSGGSTKKSVSIIAMTAAALLCLWILGSLNAIPSGL
ncbi:hypothetical protein N7G274_002924 [Stereocaulon virgatum]|uniref:Uncharacterized protein n=1 Tax=Stereocaulon virgatum TaxID=373712 RepID=A0ABR4AEG3_9LECA